MILKKTSVFQIALVITDGKQTTDKGDYELLEVASKGLKAAGVRIYSMGIGKYVNKAELVSVASHPNFVFQVEKFDSLEKLSEDVKHKFCKGIVHTNF